MYTPRHLRRGNKAGQGKDKEKQKAFRRAALKSKLFIYQSASSLEGNHEYLKWCKSCDDRQNRKVA